VPFAPDPGIGKLVPQSMHRFQHEIALVDVDNDSGFGFVDDELAVFDVVSERRHATHPQALFLRGGDLVADPFTDDLALELGER
jgi:hypothetical protein